MRTRLLPPSGRGPRWSRQAGIASLLAAVALIPAPLGARPPVAPAAPSPAGGAEVPAPGDPTVRDLLLELRVGRVVRQVVTGIEVDETLLLPAEPTLRLAGIQVNGEDGGSLVAIRWPEGRRIEILPGSTTVLVDGAPLEAPYPLLMVHRGTTYLATPTLERILEVRIEVNPVDLTVTLLDAEHLPVMRQAERALRLAVPEPPPDLRGTGEGRALGATPRRDGASPGIASPAAGVSSRGLTAEWSVYGALDRPAESAGGSLLLATELLGGSARVGGRHIAGSREVRPAATFGFQRAWGQGDHPLRLELGDAWSSGQRPLELRGVHLTNAPWTRAHRFGEGLVEGTLEPGWEVEIRRQGVPLGVVRTDPEGRFELGVPLAYGENALELRAFGPWGQMEVRDWIRVIPLDRLPEGHLEWGLSAGTCLQGECHSAATVDLRYGLSARTTLRATFEYLQREDGSSLLLPWLSAGTTPLRSLDLSVHLVPGRHTRLTGSWNPGRTLRLRGSHSRTWGDGVGPTRPPSGARSTSEGQLLLRPIAASPTAHLLARGTLDRRPGRTFAALRIAGSLPVGLGRMEGGLVGDWFRIEPPTQEPAAGPATWRDPIGSSSVALPTSSEGRSWRLLAGWTTPVVRPGGTGSTTRPAVLGVDVELGSRGHLERLRARLSGSAGPSARFELSADWTRTLGGSFGVTAHLDLDGIRTTTRWRGGPGTPSEWTQFAQGSLRWHPGEEGLAFARGTAAGQARISGTVFLDENGDGAHDPGEPGVAGVRVLVGGRIATTDAHGRYTLDDLPPFTETPVEILSASIPHPAWIAATGRIELLLPASGARRLDLPLVPAAEVRGIILRVAADGTERPLRGVEVILEPLAPGAPTHRTTTFSDGEFYLMGVLPGLYRVHVSADGLLTDREGAPPVLEVRAAPGGGVATVPDLIVRAPTGDETPDLATLDPTGIRP